MIIEQSIPLLDGILGGWAATVGADFPGYRNHVYRVINFCFALRDLNDEDRQKLIIAGCFHDLGIWTKETVDYLPPSIALATDYLMQKGSGHWAHEIELIIDMHHKVRPFRDERFPLVEVFRKADLIDVSLGVVSSGLPKSFVANVKHHFPNAGFHKRLIRLAGGWFSRNPFTPPPFMKW